jgi:hypothetical protein
MSVRDVAVIATGPERGFYLFIIELKGLFDG